MGDLTDFRARLIDVAQHFQVGDRPIGERIFRAAARIDVKAESKLRIGLTDAARPAIEADSFGEKRGYLLWKATDEGGRNRLHGWAPAWPSVTLQPLTPTDEEQGRGKSGPSSTEVDPADDPGLGMGVMSVGFEGPAGSSAGSSAFGFGRRTTTREEQEQRRRADVQDRTVPVLPAFDGEYRGDNRYERLLAVLPPGVERLPAGTAGTVLDASTDAEQVALFLPAGGGPLVAVNFAGDPKMSSLVSDLDDEDKIDEDRQAPLHSMMRVVRLDDLPSGVPAQESLAWQLTGAGQDDAAGFGLVYGRGPTDSALAEPILGETLVPSPPGDGGPPRQISLTPDPGTKERPPKQLEGEPTEDDDEGAASAIVAFGASLKSGPFEVGSKDDRHRHGTTLDGEPVNSLHLSTEAYFRADDQRDGPLTFGGDYTPPTNGPHIVDAAIVWDPEALHEFAAGERAGRWKIQASSHMSSGSADPDPIPGIPGQGRGGSSRGGGGGGGGGPPTSPPPGGGGGPGPAGGGGLPGETTVIPLGEWIDRNRPKGGPKKPPTQPPPGGGGGGGGAVPPGVGGVGGAIGGGLFPYGPFPPGVIAAAHVEGGGQPLHVPADPAPSQPVVGHAGPLARGVDGYAHTSQCLAVPGVLLKAVPYANGEVDYGRAGTLTPQARRELSLSPHAAALVAFAGGDGTAVGWEYTTDPGRGAAPRANGGIALLPPDSTAGDYVGTGAGSFTSENTTYFAMPRNVVKQHFGAINASGAAQTGVVQYGSALGLSWRVVDSGSEVSTPRMDFGEGSLLVTGDAEVTGKLTVGGLIDPTGLVLYEQASDPMSGSEVGLYAGNTAAANEAWWRSDDGSLVDLRAGSSVAVSTTVTAGNYPPLSEVNGVLMPGRDNNDPASTGLLDGLVTRQNSKQQVVSAAGVSWNQTTSTATNKDAVTENRAAYCRLSDFTPTGRVTFSVSHNTSLRAFAGLINVYSTGAAAWRLTDFFNGTHALVSLVGLYFDSGVHGDGNWRFRSQSTTSNTETTTGYSVSADEVLVFEYEVVSGSQVDVKLYSGDLSTLHASASMTTNLPGGSVLLGMGAGCRNLTSSARTFRHFRWDTMLP